MGATPVDPPGFQANRSDALAPGTRLEGYVIERVIGASGFGFVYLALDPAEARRVAIKEYLPDTLAVRDEDGMQVLVRADSHIEAFERGREAFIEEANLLARCEHPSLLHVIRSWQSKGTAYRVMPYYPGNSLLTLREAMDAPPDEASLRALLDGLMGALETLHESGVIHREVAPWNILLLPDDTPILLDFNAARRAMVGHRARALMSLLTPTFAPIELTDPSIERPIGPWTDIHALGAVIKYCISAEMPRVMTAASPCEPLATLVRRLQADFPKLHYSPSFLTAIDAALALNPEDRPQSVAALRKRLDDHPAALVQQGDEALETGEFPAAQGHAPEPQDEPTPKPFDAKPPASGDASEKPKTEAAPPADADAPPASSREPFLSVLSSSTHSNARRFEPATNDSAFTTPSVPPAALETATPQSQDFAARSDDRWVRLDFATRSRRKRRRALAAGVVLMIGAAGTAAWWLDQQRNASETQSAFEQALKRDLGINPAERPATREAAMAPEQLASPRPASIVQPVPASQAAAALPAEPTHAVVSVNPGNAANTPGEPSVTPPVAVLPPAESTVTPARPLSKLTPLPHAATATKQANVATSSAGTESAMPARNGPAVPKSAASPREACGDRTEFSLYRCMKTQCAQAQWVQHPSCKRLRARDEVG